MTADARTQHRSALVLATGYVGRVEAADLSRSTPCAGWTLADLLAHMVGQHLGFAAAVGDGDAPKAAYAPVPFTPDRWAESVEALTAAFAGADVEGHAVEIEFSPDPLPIPVLVGAQLLDTVIHTWDVARSLGQDFVPPPDLAAAVLRIAETIPDDGRREQPGAAFAHALPATGEPWERALALLGRTAP